MYSLQYTDNFPDNKKITIVFFSFEETQLKGLLTKMGYDEQYEGVPVPLKSKNNVIMFHIDKEKLYVSLKKIARKLSEYSHSLCISLANVPYQYKLLILHFVCKYNYTFDKYLSKERRMNKIIYIKDEKKNKVLIERLIQQLDIVNVNRDFQNEPANIINPASFCEHSKKMLKGIVKVSEYDDKALQKMRLSMISEMGKASVIKPRLLEIKYNCGIKGAKTVCLIGKGVTFDSGGLNIKDSRNMETMKLDKSGGSTVVCALKYAGERRIGCNVIGLVPLIENAVSGEGLHPGDILKSYKNKTVEIVNTDAEGRIILANAIEYSEKWDPDYIIDLATLTGSAELFHCDVSAVFYTLDEKFSEIIKNIGNNIGERVVAMPTWPEYKEYTRGEVANVKNFGFGECKKASTYMAAMFLLNFVPDKMKNRWIHFDIANIVDGEVINGNCTLLLLNLLEYISANE